MKTNTTQTKLVLGLQHVLAMFGATVLVPFLTGLNPSIALLSAGIGTLIFHYCTKKIVPVFLGSSFAFIGALTLILKEEGIASVKGGVIAAGFVYVLMVIGLRLSPVALSMSGYKDGNFDPNSLIVALVVIITMITVSILEKSFFRLVPILIAVFLGYLTAMSLGMVGFSSFEQASWFGFSDLAKKDLLTIPVFTMTAILGIAPIALVVFIEHIGDIATNGAVVGKDFFKNPGITRTLFGDGLATIVAGFLGGPAVTTYGENTGVLAVTKVYDPAILRIAAVYAILLGVIGKFGAVLQTIPTPVMGGVSIILFGMIASVGVRTVVTADIDFSHSRNLIIASLIFVLGIAIGEVNIPGNISLSGLTIAAFIGVFLNKILPADQLNPDPKEL